MKRLHLICILAYLFIGTASFGQFTTLLNFDGDIHGRNPSGSLISDGTFLYGMTVYGGVNNLGTVFKIMPDGTGYAKLLDFAGTTNGSNAFGSLISDGTFLYGMTYQGGTYNYGTIFKIKLDGTGYVKLMDFDGSTNGSYPTSSLFYDGTFLYGMTPQGGAVGVGTIFKIKPDGTAYAKLSDLIGPTEGKVPSGSLISDGTFLYGMTTYGGINNLGAIFKIMPDGTAYTNILDFEGIANGRQPHYGNLLFDGTFLYGMTEAGGASDYGTIFKIMPDGTDYFKLLDFEVNTNGRIPWGSLISDGTFLYGMTTAGGINGNGTIFQIKKDGDSYAKILDFEEATSGDDPEGDLISDGTYLYGMTRLGGTNSLGVIFKYALTVGVNELSMNDNVLFIYPNPAYENFTISINEEIKNAQIEIYNVFGEKVFSAVFQNKQETINAQQFSSGIYFVKVTDGEKSFLKKLIVE